LPPSSHASTARNLLGTPQLQRLQQDEMALQQDELTSHLVSELRSELPAQLASHK
jgi:hypothetical protein